MNKEDVKVSTALGLFGGLSLITFHALITPGKQILIPYAVLFLSIVTVIHWQKLVEFRRRFLIAVSSLSLSVVLLYCFIALSMPTQSHFIDHVLRAALLIIGTVVLSVLAALVTGTVKLGTQLEH